MAIDRDDTDDGVRADARRLLARAAAADAHARRRLRQTIDDLLLPGDARLDDRLREMLGATIAALVDTVEHDIRRGAAEASGNGAAAGIVAQGPPVLDRLAAAGLLRDLDLLGELTARVRLDLFADLLPDTAPDTAGDASLIAQLAESGDPAIVAAARTLMAAAGRRRDVADTSRMAETELPAELHHRLVWWVAATVREQVGSPAADEAIARAALRSLASHDESDSLEGAAVRLAAAIDARPNELPLLLTRSLAERQAALFVALLAWALGADYAAVREIAVDGSGERLWLALRSVGLDRSAIARIGLFYRQAGSIEEVEALADQVDAVVAVSPDDARFALAALRLPPDFRGAVAALENGR